MTNNCKIQLHKENTRGQITSSLTLIITSILIFVGGFTSIAYCHESEIFAVFTVLFFMFGVLAATAFLICGIVNLVSATDHCPSCVNDNHKQEEDSRSELIGKTFCVHEVKYIIEGIHGGSAFFHPTMVENPYYYCRDSNGKYQDFNLRFIRTMLKKETP
jgi:membrane protein implicated in regulation of membrane protease activity